MRVRRKNKRNKTLIEKSLNEIKVLEILCQKNAANNIKMSDKW